MSVSVSDVFSLFSAKTSSLVAILSSFLMTGFLLEGLGYRSVVEDTTPLALETVSYMTFYALVWFLSGVAVILVLRLCFWVCSLFQKHMPIVVRTLKTGRDLFRAARKGELRFALWDRYQHPRAYLNDDHAIRYQLNRVEQKFLKWATKLYVSRHLPEDVADIRWFFYDLPYDEPVKDESVYILDVTKMEPVDASEAKQMFPENLRSLLDDVGVSFYWTDTAGLIITSKVGKQDQGCILWADNHDYFWYLLPQWEDDTTLGVTPYPEAGFDMITFNEDDPILDPLRELLEGLGPLTREGVPSIDDPWT